MKLKKYLVLLALTSLVNGGSAKNLTTSVLPPKTNSVLALNFVLTAWPNAAGAAPAPTARRSAANLRVVTPAILRCAIQPAEDGTGDEGQGYWPTDSLLVDPCEVVELPDPGVVVELPPMKVKTCSACGALLNDPGVVAELPPDDGSVFSGEVPVEDPTILEIRTCIDPLLDDPGVVVELPPDDGSVVSGELPVEDPTISEIGTYLPTKAHPFRPGGIEDPTISEIRTYSPTAQSSARVVPNGPFRLTSKDIIASFNGVTNNGAALNFGSGAQLLLKQIASRLTVVTNTLGTNRQIIVREKKSGTNVNTDVSRFFRSTVNYYATQTANNEMRNRKLTTFALVNPGRLSFTLAALVTEVSALPTNGVAVLRTVNWGAQGSGQLSGGLANLILVGQVSGGAAKLE